MKPASFIVREIPAELWADVKTRAQHEGRFLNGLLLVLLRYYVQYGVPVAPTEETRSL